MSFVAVLRTTDGRFVCCWLAHNAVHSGMTIVDTSTVLNLEEVPIIAPSRVSGKMRGMRASTIALSREFTSVDLSVRVPRKSARPRA